MTLEREGAAQRSESGDRRPVPDPTALTTQQLLREIASIRELMETKIDSLNDKIETRLDGMDKAIALIQRDADKVPSEVDIKVGNLQALHAEKFSAVSQQFEERDTRTAETAGLSKLAIDAALQAAKEAVGKTEASFTKSIDEVQRSQRVDREALQDRIVLEVKSMDGKVDALKDRMNVIDGRKEGSSSVWAIVVAIGGAALGAIGVVIGAAIGLGGS